MENTPPTNHPWLSLATVSTFDRGTGTRTTLRLDNNNETQGNNQVVGVLTPSTSLLIESLIQQLCTMFEGDSVRRNKLYFAICDKLHELNLIDSSYNMMEFETLRGQYQRALYHLVTVARAATGSESPLQVPSCLMAEWSRYRREFQEISFIAAGGFGNVFKALHRLDGIEYAVKKIIVRSGRVKVIMQHLEEVKTLAKLNHTNIVSYKGAWIEPTLPSSFLPSLPPTDRSQNKPSTASYLGKIRSHKFYENQSVCSSSQSSYADNLVDNTRQNSLPPHNQESNYRTGMYIDVEMVRQKRVYGSSGGYIISHDIINERFQELNTTTNIIGERVVKEINSERINFEETNSNSVSFRNDSQDSGSDENHESGDAMDGSDPCEESNSNKEICTYSSRVSQQYATLYIQMALCEKTLQQWLEERMDMSSQTVITVILTQILCGLDYIHCRGIVHHDIKPSNIFISTSGNLQIQLGDFGLACPLQRETHHSVLGTHMYAAPEQLEGKCDPKSDVYSVGIVLLELLVHTKTHMERVEIINSLKRGQVPTSLAATYPRWVHLVSQLVQKDPKKRPSTSQLLRDLNEDKDMTIAQLRNDLAEKDSTIEQMQRKIRMLEAQLAKVSISPEDR